MTEFSKTIRLPNTNFSMRANLFKNEPKWISFWKENKIREKKIKKNKGLKKFILHDGPPYANGNLHLGHALNKILKDIINRSFFKLGFDIDYIPGWDCHGLPIEWKIEEKYRKSGKNKDEVDRLSFRNECREFAKSWIKIQSKEFERLGIDCNWDDIYTTMTNESESIIVSELMKFLEDDRLYLGRKPVMWSVVEKTALAEAEIEYQEKKSKSIYVKFPLKSNKNKKRSIVIWTTTPWTLPGNRAIAFSKDMTYQTILLKSDNERFNLTKGEEIIFSKKLFKAFAQNIDLKDFEIKEEFLGTKLIKSTCKHPFEKKGFDFDVPLLPGDHVTDETGSGFVHIAPSHGIDDFELGKKFNIEIPDTVDNAGIYTKDVPFFSGIHIFKADAEVISVLDENKNLISESDFTHSYPHSWRSKAPLIYRTTSQWFISMTKKHLKSVALSSIEKVNWVPSASKNRIKAMVNNRPDWCISRQRSWGVPITIFVDKRTKQPLIDKNVNSKIISLIEKNGTDIWFSKSVDFFLTSNYESKNYEKVTDILDVWFDSGSSHAYVLKNRGLDAKADLYLEGSDQHRGWFQSSLFSACANYGDSPYKSVLTHGFVLDSKGKKMSKSMGNVISPEDVINKYGADILRLWVATSNYNEDLRISYESLERQTETYRKIRNSLRFLLGNLKDWKKEEEIPHKELPELEKYIRAKLFNLNTEITEGLKSYNFYRAYQLISNFCNNELSSLFFDIRKDALYCEDILSLKRRASRTVMIDVFKVLLNWLSPVLVFTCEEAWQSWRDEIDDTATESCHLESFVEIPNEWKDNLLIDKWIYINNIRRVVSGAIEKKRDEKQLKSSLESKISLYFDDNVFLEKIKNIDLLDILIASDVEIITEKDESFLSSHNEENVFVKVDVCKGKKCERCWKVFSNISESLICKRCDEVIKSF